MEHSGAFEYVDDLVVQVIVITRTARRYPADELREPAADDVGRDHEAELTIFAGRQRRLVGHADSHAAVANRTRNVGWQRRQNRDDRQFAASELLDRIRLAGCEVDADLGLEGVALCAQDQGALPARESFAPVPDPRWRETSASWRESLG